EEIPHRSLGRLPDDVAVHEPRERYLRRHVRKVLHAIEEDQLGFRELDDLEPRMRGRLVHDRELALPLAEVTQNLVVMRGHHIEGHAGMLRAKPGDCRGRNLEPQRRKYSHVDVTSRATAQIASRLAQ